MEFLHTKLDKDFNYVKAQDWIKRKSGLQKRLDSIFLNENKPNPNPNYSKSYQTIPNQDTKPWSIVEHSRIFQNIPKNYKEVREW